MKTLTRYIPKGLKIIQESQYAVVYGGESPVRKGQYVGIGFIGKSSKHSFYYGFPSIKDMNGFITTWMENVNKNMDARAVAKAKRAEERKAPTTFKIGDILYTSWGYDQTNINFYKIVGLKGKQTVELQEIGSKIVSGAGGPTTHVVANPDRFINDKVLLKRAINNHVKINSYASATLWDGKPKYETGAGWGH